MFVYSGRYGVKACQRRSDPCPFNALPIGSLDGGQALSLILCRYLSIEKALLAADIISVLTLIPLTAFGFLVLMKTGYNFSVLLAAIYLAAQIIIKDCKKRGK